MSNVRYVNVFVSYTTTSKSKKEKDLELTKKIDMPTKFTDIKEFKQSKSDMDYIKEKLPKGCKTFSIKEIEIIRNLS